MRTTLEQRQALLDRCRASVKHWQSKKPEEIYLPLTKARVLRIERSKGKPPRLVWL